MKHTFWHIIYTYFL